MPDLKIDIISDLKGDGFDQAESKLDRIGKFAAGAAVAGLTAVGVAAGALGVSAVKGAGDLEQSIGAIDTVFKDSADQMHAWASSAAVDVGLTRNEFNELGTLIGTQLRNGGTAMEDLGPKTQNLIGLGADLSSMFGGSTREAVEALSSALKGERDPIERYGVSLTQAAIDAEAASLGFDKVGGSLSAEASQAATLSLIMKQTADAHGNFASESDTFAHKQQVFAASLENVKDKLGTALLPIATKVFGWLADTAVPVVEDVVDAIDNLMNGGGDFAANLNIEGAAAAFKTLWDNVSPLIGTFKDFLTDSLIPTALTIQNAVTPVIQALAETVLPPLRAALEKIIPAVKPLLTAVGELATALGERLTPVIQFLQPVVELVFNIIGDVISAAIGVITGVITTFTALLKGDWDGVWNGLKDTASAVWDLITATISNAASAIVGLLGGSWESVESSASNAWNSVTATVSGAWESAMSAVSNGVGNVVSFVQDLPGRITGALSGLGGQLYSMGSDMMQGLINGIRAAAGRVVDAAKGVVGDALAGAKRLLGIASPSRAWYTEIGVNSVLGAANAFRDKAYLVRDAARDLVAIPAAESLAAPEITLRAIASLGSPSQSGTSPTVVHITINGAVDRIGTARQIADLLRAEGVLVGRSAA